jgi:ribosomal protein L35AE/L33A
MTTVVGCSESRYAANNVSNTKIESTDEILNRVIGNNLSEGDFYIEKGSVAIKVNEESKKFLFSLKYQKPDTYLISLRSITGIEGARIYISGDSVFINERIGKRLITGRLQNLERLSGFPSIFLKALFGDMIINEKGKKEEVKRAGSILIINQSFYGKVSESVVDQRQGKVVSMKVLEDRSREVLTLTYSKFGRSSNNIPQIIEISELSRNIEAKIRIEKIQVPWKGIIEFIPGKGYTREELR